MIRIVSTVIIIFAILIFILGGYLLGKGDKVKSTPTQTSENTNQNIAPQPSQSTPFPSSTSSPKPADSKQALIKALYDKSYVELLPFFADKVDVLIEATECCGITTGAEADTRALGYLNSAKGEWNFDQNSPAIIGIKGENPAGFQNTIVGSADNKYILKLTLDENSKIKIVVFANQ